MLPGSVVAACRFIVTLRLFGGDQCCASTLSRYIFHTILGYGVILEVFIAVG